MKKYWIVGRDLCFDIIYLEGIKFSAKRANWQVRKIKPLMFIFSLNFLFSVIVFISFLLAFVRFWSMNNKNFFAMSASYFYIN